ncbi:c-type cytochrome biogenesis protein CcmI [Salipiger sp.]|uniref:c-type cytochrome biogenesis protein CcmI n=1 Tax=Salipiger sp. TaxID=2078585 RepID=UPI003A974B51
MALFWTISACVALAVAGVLSRALLRGRREPEAAGAYDLQVYRDQLKEIDRDAARGTVAPEEAARLRTEVSRRILAADDRATVPPPETPRGPRIFGAALVTVALLAGTFALYARLGAPGYRDVALSDRIAAARTLRETRPSQAEIEARLPETPSAEAPADYLALVERLRAAVTERPDDLQGHVLLARSEAALGNYRRAYAAQRRLIALKGEAATAADYADLADMLVIAAGGYVSPEAEEALDEVMSRDPANGVARYYGGLMMAQSDRPDAAFRIWDQLLRESGADEPWVAPIRQEIGDMAIRAGINDYTPPDFALPGPSAADMADAAAMSEEDRAAMIRGMVDRLSDRLATDGGTPEEWARLIGALATLGETDRASAIRNEARTVFATDPEALATIRAAADRAGIAE